MKDIYYVDVESLKKDSKNPNHRVSTTDLIVKKEGKQLKVLDCRMEGGISYGIGNMIKATKIGIMEFIHEAVDSFNANPNKPEGIKLQKHIFSVNDYKTEATKDILPDKVLVQLGINPDTVTRPV